MSDGLAAILDSRIILNNVFSGTTQPIEAKLGYYNLPPCLQKNKNYDVTCHMVWRPSWIEKRTLPDKHETSQTCSTTRMEAEYKFMMS